jgi:hypothetical protein
MLADAGARREAAEAAHYWMLARGWDGVGQRLAGMLRGLFASRPGNAGIAADLDR